MKQEIDSDKLNIDKGLLTKKDEIYRIISYNQLNELTKLNQLRALASSNF